MGCLISWNECHVKKYPETGLIPLQWGCMMLMPCNMWQHTLWYSTLYTIMRRTLEIQIIPPNLHALFDRSHFIIVKSGPNKVFLVPTKQWQIDQRSLKWYQAWQTGRNNPMFFVLTAHCAYFFHRGRELYSNKIYQLNQPFWRLLICQEGYFNFGNQLWLIR